MVQVIYIDDETDKSYEGGERYKSLVNSHDKLECTLLPPPKLGKITEIVEAETSLFLVDYLLSHEQSDGRKASYSGTTLAEQIRSTFPETPIILLTNRSVLDGLDPHVRDRIVFERPSYDELMIKGEYAERPEYHNNVIYNIATGYDSLRGVEDRNWESLSSLLHTRDSESDELEELSPPIAGNTWSAASAAKWIRHKVLRWPGVLYDSLHAATHLGLSHDQFLSDRVQDTFPDAKYDGIFAPPEGRWWKQRLTEAAKNVVLDHGEPGPVGQTFVPAFETAHGVELDRACCVWDREPIANEVCYVMDQPVKRKHSLRYYPDGRPSKMDTARVSFRAIREKVIDYDLIDPDAQNLITKIETMNDPTSNDGSRC